MPVAELMSGTLAAGLALWAARQGRGRRDAEAQLLAARSAQRAAEAALAERSRLLAVTAHELRVPLGGMIGMAGLLLDTGLAPDQATYAGAIRGAGQGLLVLLEEVLDASRIEAGRLDLVDAPFSPVELVERAVELLAPQAHAKGIEVAAHVAARGEAAVPARLVGDAGRLGQVLVNLLGNAIAFTRRGGVAVRVAAVDGSLVVEVEDTGAGIAPETLDRLFAWFERGDRRVGGSGLGLAISRRIAERMGGTLGATSRLGRGSCFRLAVPLRAAEAERRPVAATLMPAGRTALVLTPSCVLGPALAGMLADLGLAVRVEAEATRGELADVVLADRALGLDAVAGLARSGLAAGRRVIVLLRPEERGDIPHLRACGMAGYLIKPVRAASLATLLAGPPRQGASHGVGPQPVARPVPRDRPLAGLTLLLAEDEEVGALLGRVALERLGARVRPVADGRAALDLLGREKVDAALLDLSMPGPDGTGLGGLAAARAIRSREGVSMGKDRLPLLALTAGLSAEEREATRAAGFDGHLAKPLEAGALLAALLPLVGRMALARSA